MGYRFKVKNGLVCRYTKEYPWPCERDPNRMYKVFGIDGDQEPDIFTRNPRDGKLYKQNGIMTFGHLIPDEDLVPVPDILTDDEGNVNMEML